jgi:hypothetical protein
MTARREKGMIGAPECGASLPRVDRRPQGKPDHPGVYRYAIAASKPDVHQNR